MAAGLYKVVLLDCLPSEIQLPEIRNIVLQLTSTTGLGRVSLMLTWVRAFFNMERWGDANHGAIRVLIVQWSDATVR